ncbi:MAG: hypothetical protein JNL82_30415 [Myxococcales bacterium]|nr:hypothetical protein [Myxococcales bacterium]
MQHHATTAAILLFSAFTSMGAFCAPEPTQPPPTYDDSEGRRKVFAQTYTLMEPLIKDNFPKIELQEAQYQDWHASLGDAERSSSTYGVVVKQHDDLVARTASARSEYEAWTAYFEAHKDSATNEERTKLVNDAQAAQKNASKVYMDYGSLKSTMMQIKP